MTTKSATAALQDRLTVYKQAQAAINGNGQLSESYKKTRLEQLFNETMPKVESSVQHIFGAIENDPDSRLMLSSQAVAWREMDAAEKALGNARQKFLTSRFRNPELHEVIKDRCLNILMKATSLQDFLKRYENCAPDEQVLFQELSHGLLAQRHDLDLHLAAARLSRERDAAEATATESAQNAMNQTVTDAYNALLVSREAANLFGRASYYLGQYENGIYSTQYPHIEVTARPFGVSFNNKRVHKIETDIPWPIPSKAKRG